MTPERQEPAKLVRHPHLTAPPLVGRSRLRQIGSEMERAALDKFKQEMASRGILFRDL